MIIEHIIAVWRDIQTDITLPYAYLNSMEALIMFLLNSKKGVNLANA